MGCKYHGWSYDTMGKLIKAPQMDLVEGFDKSEYPLFEIHTYTTCHGHVFVNFEAEEKPGVKFEEWFKGLEGEMKEFPFENYELYEILLIVGLMKVILRMKWRGISIGRH